MASVVALIPDLLFGSRVVSLPRRGGTPDGARSRTSTSSTRGGRRTPGRSDRGRPRARRAGGRGGSRSACASSPYTRMSMRTCGGWRRRPVLTWWCPARGSCAKVRRWSRDWPAEVLTARSAVSNIACTSGGRRTSPKRASQTGPRAQALGPCPARRGGPPGRGERGPQRREVGSDQPRVKAWHEALEVCGGDSRFRDRQLVTPHERFTTARTREGRRGPSVPCAEDEFGVGGGAETDRRGRRGSRAGARPRQRPRRSRKP